MSKVHCFTSATYAYLDRVRVLGETLRRQHPDWVFWLCLPDAPPPGFTLDAARESFDHIVGLSDLGLADLGIDNLQAWIFEHDIVELCTAVKGPMLRWLLAGGAEKVIYLDPDIAVLGDLGPVERLLDRHAVVLTPHLVHAESGLQGILDNEIGALKHGIYNLGFIAVANTQTGRRFADWWCDRLLALCFDDIPAGIFTDQRWCDHVPALFDDVHVLRDPGYNVASWNVAHRPVEIGLDGVIRAGGHALRFFHFTKLTTVGRMMLELNAGDQPPVFELVAWYEARLTAHADRAIPEGWWAYGSFADGAPITRAQRRLYRDNPALRDRFPDPFATTAAAFTAADAPDVAPTTLPDMPVIRVAVLGSCVSGLVLRGLGLGRRDLVASFARMSLASLTAPAPANLPAEATLLDTLDLKPNERDWLEGELCKSVPATLAASRPDILVVDLLEERFDLLETTGGGLFTESADFVSSGLAALPPFHNARRVPRLSEEAWQLWESGLLRLRAWADTHLPPHCRIVLVPAFWAQAYRTPEGIVGFPDTLDIIPGRSVARAAYADLLERQTSRFLEVFPDAHALIVPDELRLADPEHHWGLSPFHYVPEYYARLGAQLDEIAGGRVSGSAPISAIRATLTATADRIHAGAPLEDHDDIHPEWRRMLRAIAAGIGANGPQRFTRLPIIAHTMFIADEEDTARQLNALRRRPDWHTRWQPALVESPVGAPAPSQLYPPSSGNQIRQAYILARFEDEMARPIDSFDRIVEFGGGFGALCLLAHRLGFRGRYVLIDNEPVRALQQWYLASNGLSVAPDATLPVQGGIRTVPTSMLEAALEGSASAAFLANWSLSETGTQLRNRVLDALRRAQVDAIWIAYQQLFEVDNAAYFASRLKDFLGVYDASIRPFQPDAAPGSYARGHACLALCRIPGRAFSAAQLRLALAPFEAVDMPELPMAALAAEIRGAIIAGRPYCALRLGDGEGRIIGYPRYVARSDVADIWQTWFGHPNFEAADIARIRTALQEACLDADAIGVPQAPADIDSDFGRVKLLLPREGFVHRHTSLCHAGFHIGFHRDGRYHGLFQGLPRIGVIGPRDITDILPRLFGVAEVTWLPVPPEMRFSDLPAAEKAALVENQTHLAMRYPALMDDAIPGLMQQHPGLVVLVGAGILGKIYCHRVKQLGGIAIDVGSMMDLWAGLRTRDNPRFEGLRPVLA